MEECGSGRYLNAQAPGALGGRSGAELQGSQRKDEGLSGGSIAEGTSADGYLRGLVVCALLKMGHERPVAKVLEEIPGCVDVQHG